MCRSDRSDVPESQGLFVFVHNICRYLLRQYLVEYRVLRCSQWALLTVRFSVANALTGWALFESCLALGLKQMRCRKTNIFVLSREFNNSRLSTESSRTFAIFLEFSVREPA